MNLLDHLESRGMDVSLYSLSCCEQEGLVYFYLYSGTRLVGYQQYRPETACKKTNNPKEARYFTYLPREVDGLWGLQQDSGRGTLFIVEGVFKAAKLHKLGYNAVAVLGATPKRLKGQIKLWRSTRKVVAIGDADPAGAALVRIVGIGVQSPTDLDEMEDSEVHKLVKFFT